MLLRAEDGSCTQLADRVGQLGVVAELERQAYAPELARLPVAIDPVPEVGVPRCIAGEHGLEKRVTDMPKRVEVLRRITVGRRAPVDDAHEPAVLDEEVLVPEVSVALAGLKGAESPVGAY
jgi:hypothetical protein